MTEKPRPLASSPCMAEEFDLYGAAEADPQQALEVARWRRAERERLRAARMALSVEVRELAATAIRGHLDGLLARRFGAVAGRVVSGYWPIKGEPNLRGWMTALHEAGALVALPLVEIPAAPLVFRRWTPETRMVRGFWNIPVPPPEAEAVQPEIALSPLVGWDDEGYRLGYGGGYFDRTLAAAEPRPFVVGTGFAAARVATIFPQPHDIPMGAIVTEAGVMWEAGG